MASFGCDSILSSYGLSYDLLRWKPVSHIREWIMLSMDESLSHDQHLSLPIVYFMTMIWRVDDEYDIILRLLMEYFTLPSLSDLDNILKASMPPGYEKHTKSGEYESKLPMSRGKFVVKSTYNRRQAFVTLINAYIDAKTVFTDQQQFAILLYALELDGQVHYMFLPENARQESAYDQLTTFGKLNPACTNEKGQTAKQKKNAFYDMIEKRS